MKKKLTVAIVLILLLAISLTMLVGCDEIFKKNDERDARQVVATVNYKGQSANIYKFELESSFNSYAYAYNSYYGMTYEQAANYLLQSLAQQKLLVLYAKAKVSEMTGLKSIPENVEKLLSASEKNKAIETTNDSLLSALNSLIKDSITEDNYNSGTSTSTTTEKETEITKAVYVRFDSKGGSDVERLRIQKNTTVKEPDDPTYSGYTFYGWYDNEEFEGDTFKFREYDKKGKDIGKKVTESITLYAKWEKYDTPRTEKPKADEEDEYDPNDNTVKLSPKFFTKAYYATLYDKVNEEDYVDQMTVKSGSTYKKTLTSYIDNALTKLKKNLKQNLYMETEEECYNYYLTNQMETLLVTKLERLIGKSVKVTRAEVEAEFNRILATNKETFANSDSSYSSALSDKLANTFYHPATDNSYGFVVNILLRLDDDSLKELTDMLSSNPANTESVKIRRNQLLSEMTIKVSNPDYDSTAVVKDTDNKEIELRDPMTDPNNPYNGIKAIPGYFAHEYQVEISDGVYNDYSNLVSFEVDNDGNCSIVYGATEHPAMAYLLETVPAFDNGNVKGVIHQIYDSFAQVRAAVEEGKITRTQGVYWLREVATAWLYLVGDDSGAVSDSSNNGGLGYLVTPEGEDSSFLEDFTTYARNLISNGTGSFSVGDVDVNEMFKGSQPDGTLAGDGHVYVAADSFIDSGSTSNAYAGIFVLLNSYTVWDASFYAEYADDSAKLANNTLPLDYIVSFTKDMEDNDPDGSGFAKNTIGRMIYDSLLSAKRSSAYQLDVNTMGAKEMENIVYYEKAYKSLWKDLDD